MGGASEQIGVELVGWLMGGVMDRRGSGQGVTCQMFLRYVHVARDLVATDRFS